MNCIKTYNRTVIGSVLAIKKQEWPIPKARMKQKGKYFWLQRWHACNLYQISIPVISDMQFQRYKNLESTNIQAKDSTALSLQYTISVFWINHSKNICTVPLLRKLVGFTFQNSYQPQNPTVLCWRTSACQLSPSLVPWNLNFYNGDLDDERCII